MSGFALPLDTEPMEAKLVAALPTERGWQFEPKWDGFRCLAFKGGHQVDLRAKSGKPLGRYFPEMIAALAAAPIGDAVLDGELLIAVDDVFSFSALQDRLHPAESRVRKLSVATPAVLMAFDCLAGPEPLLGAGLAARRAVLERLVGGLAASHRIRLSPFTTDAVQAETWLTEAHGALDGVVAKRQDAPYAPGRREMLKVKRGRTADCVVGGYRTWKDTSEVGSMLLGLYDDAGKLDHVGFCSAISAAERPALTERLRSLRGGPGFTGEAPGGPSRWSTVRSAQWEPLRPELVMEAGFDQVTDGRLRHGASFVRWRPDKAARQCTREQLAQPAPGLLVRRLLMGDSE